MWVYSLGYKVNTAKSWNKGRYQKKFASDIAVPDANIGIIPSLWFKRCSKAQYFHKWTPFVHGSCVLVYRISLLFYHTKEKKAVRIYKIFRIFF